MRTLLNAVVYGSEHVKAVDLAAGLGLAVLATADVPGFLAWLAGAGAVFLLGRELLHHYSFTTAWLRAAAYQEAELRRKLDDWSDETKKADLPPLTADEVETEARKLQDGEPT